MIDVSIIIITYNRINKIERLLESIFNSETNGLTYEIIVVDDCSPDNTYKHLCNKYGNKNNVTLLKNLQNSKASFSRNVGIKKAIGKYLFVIDDDVILEKNTLLTIVHAYQNFNKDNIILSPIILEHKEPDKIWFAGLKMNFWLTTGKFLFSGKNILESDFLTEFIETDAFLTAFFISKNNTEKIGNFDELNLPFQFEELDYFVRSSFLGFSKYVNSNSRIYHDHEHGAFINIPWRLEFEVRNRLLTARLWSKNRLQEIIAIASATCIPCIYLFFKIFVFRKNFLDCIKSIIRGYFSGILRLSKIIPYRITFK